MHTYTEAFAWRNVQSAQVLLTRDDLGDRRRFLNARNTLQTLLALGVVPVINENDTVSVDEIKFGDNDTLAALVATLVEADLLLILSDVEGLYDRSPDAPDAQIISCVERVDSRIAALAGGSASGVGTGGMQTKVEAARIATTAGIRTVIARGRRERVIPDVVNGEAVGTTFLPCADESRLPARKRWIAHSPRPRGTVTVNTGAKARLQYDGVSLLAVGITDVAGTFTSGDLIEVRDEAGRVFARGLTNYAAAELRRLQGLRSEQFEEILGYRAFEEVIHRDNLVVDTEDKNNTDGTD
jgi:glutamate 5-kinase